jgi:hypothetical protein
MLLFPSAGGIGAPSAVEVERIRSNLVAHIRPSGSRKYSGGNTNPIMLWSLESKKSFAG